MLDDDIRQDWAFWERAGMMPYVDPVRLHIIQEGRALRRPSPAHDMPGGVKVDDGECVQYIRPLSQPCVDDGCRLYLWDDTQGAGIWMQHGDNPEAVRLFPRRFFLEPSFPCSATRPDVFSWIIACHRYAGSRVRV